MFIFNFTLTEIFLIWYGIGFLLALLVGYLTWVEGDDVFVPAIFFAAFLGPILIAPILIEYNIHIYRFFVIPGKNRR